MPAPDRPRIASDDLGSGPTALLHLPGWCAHRSVFGPLLPLVARHHRALALDWRSHGDSEASPSDFGEAELVEDALGVVAASGAEQVVPVALAHAGWVAIELRRRLGPDRVPAMILVDWMPLGAPAPFFDALAGLQDPARWEATRAGLFGMWTEGVDLPALDAHIEEMAGHGEAMWSRAARAIEASFTAHPRPLDAVAELDPRCPTLHVYAQPADPAVLAAQEAYAADHPWFTVTRLDARSHFPMLECPAALDAAMAEFLDATLAVEATG